MFFVVGSSRSGTTMVGTALGQHSKVFCLPELHVFEQFISTNQISAGMSVVEARKMISWTLSVCENGFYHNHDLARYRLESKNILDSFSTKQNGLFDAIQLFQETVTVEANKHGKEIPCEQTPRNCYYVAEILASIPDARIVYMVRDPRDIMLSQKNKWRRKRLGDHSFTLFETVRSWVNYHPVTVSLLWRAAEKNIEIFDSNPKVLQLKFEALLLEPELHFRQLCTFLELDFEMEMLNVPRINSSLVMDDPTCRGVDVSRMGQWKRGGLSNEEIYICQCITGGLMTKRNYSRVDVKVNPLRLLWLLMTWPVKLCVAALLNIGRARNLMESISRRINPNETR